MTEHKIEWLRRLCGNQQHVAADIADTLERLTADGKIMRKALKEISGAKYMTCDKGDEPTKAINHDAMIVYADEALSAISGSQE